MTPPDRPTRVVHVEDKAADATTVRRLIEEIAPEVEVINVDSGEALQELLAQPDEARHTDLVLMDLRMPRMSGYESIAWLKNQTELVTIPIVVLSSSSSPDDVNTAYAQGVNAYLVKSADLDRYRDKLAATLALWCAP